MDTWRRFVKTGAAKATPRAAHGIDTTLDIDVPGNNLGNLRMYRGIKWYDEDRSGLKEGDITKFKSPFWGGRAAIRNLITQIIKHKLDTIGKFVPKWAPKADRNDPERYKRTVSAVSKVPVDRAIDVNNTGQLVDLARGIFTAEHSARVANSISAPAYTNMVRMARMSL